MFYGHTQEKTATFMDWDEDVVKVFLWDTQIPGRGQGKRTTNKNSSTGKNILK